MLWQGFEPRHVLERLEQGLTEISHHVLRVPVPASGHGLPRADRGMLIVSRRITCLHAHTVHICCLKMVSCV